MWAAHRRGRTLRPHCGRTDHLWRNPWAGRAGRAERAERAGRRGALEVKPNTGLKSLHLTAHRQIARSERRVREMLVGGTQEGCPSCRHWNLSRPCARSKPWTNSMGAVVGVDRKEWTGETRRGRRGRRGIERRGVGGGVDDATRAQILGEEVRLRTTRRAPSILMQTTTMIMGNHSFSIQSDLANGEGEGDRRPRRRGRMCGTGTINTGAGDSE